MILLSYGVNYDYVKNVLCENKDNPDSCCKGKCFLDKQMKKSDNESKEQMISRYNLSEHLNSFFDYDPVLFSSIYTDNFTVYSIHPIITNDTPPPEFSWPVLFPVLSPNISYS